MERRIDIEKILPADAYLASFYHDQRRQFFTRRIYFNDGRVMAFDGNEWWQVGRLSGQQVEQARQIIVESGLVEAADLPARQLYDAATLTYAWRLDGKEGMLVNRYYPAVPHPAMEKLEDLLDQMDVTSNPA